MRRIASVALAAALSAFLVPGAPISGASGQTLNLAAGAPVTSPDPHGHALSPNHAVADMLFDSLTRFDARARVVPRFAESRRPVSESVGEFRPRPGLRFHDGNESMRRGLRHEARADELTRAQDVSPAQP